MRSAVTFVVVILAAGLALAGTQYTPGPAPMPSTLEGPLTVNGAVTMTTGPLGVTGASSFSQPPTGLVRKGVLTRGSSLGLAIGCVSVGTVAVPGVTVESGCMVTYRPTAITFGGVFDCYVTSANTVTVRGCALLALLSAPTGDYGVTLVGE